MSLLADKDYLLQTLRLSYIRHVLPSHAPLSTPASASGSTSTLSHPLYNLITFDPSSPTLQNPYVVLGGLADEEIWPELARGRESPPLAGAGSGFGAKERGGARVGYSETIGGGAGAGMRVGGRRKRGERTEENVLQREEMEHREETVVRRRSNSEERMPRSSLEMTMHHRRLVEDLTPLPGLPPVIIHSPALTPQDSPISANSPNRIQKPPLPPLEIRTTLLNLVGDGPETPTENDEDDIDEEDSRVPDTPTRDSLEDETTGSFGSPVASDDEDENDDFDRAPFDLEGHLDKSVGARNVKTSTTLDEDASMISNYDQEAVGADRQQGQPSSFTSTSNSQIDSTATSQINDGEEGVGEGRFASLASSGISLFGVPRLQQGASDNRDDEDLLVNLTREQQTSVEVGAVNSNASEEAGGDVTKEEEEEEGAAPAQAKTPRTTRERRRVNISGRMLVPISEPPNEEDHTVLAPLPSPMSALEPIMTSTSVTNEGTSAGFRARSNTDPNSLMGLNLEVPNQSVVGGRNLVAASLNKRLNRKVSAPSLLLQRSSMNFPTSSLLAPPAHQVPSTTLPPLNSLLPVTPAPSSLPTSSIIPPSTPTTPTKTRATHHTPSLTFPSRSKSSFVRSPLPQRSALTALISSKSDSPSATNPFSTFYAALASRDPNALKLSLYFPHSKEPGKKVSVGVKRDLSVEEVIGAGLWAYWEEGREPKLEVGDEEENEAEESTRWNLRIVEDDGIIDEDFPALDRTRAISAFSFGEFAIVQATPNQIKDNLVKQSTIVRRPSRILTVPKQSHPTPAIRAPPPPAPAPVLAPLGLLAAPVVPGGTSVGVTSFRPETMAQSSALAIPVLLKIKLTPGPGVEAVTTSLVPNDMYLEAVLDLICKKRGLETKDYAFIVKHNGTEIVVPLDRTVDSLGDRTEDLALVKRSEVESLRGTPVGKKTRTVQLQNTNPSASIFKRLSEPPQPKYQSASDVTSTYQRYTVQRKLPMPLARHPRTIAIDGNYIHFLPSDSKGMSTEGRTTSFHISGLKDCRVSKRSPTSFKITVGMGEKEKRYDFDAENAKVASEIVGNLMRLKARSRELEEAKKGR